MSQLNRRTFVKGAALLGTAVAAGFAGTAVAEEKGEAAQPEGAGVVLQIFAANSLEKALPPVQALFTEKNPQVTFADTQFKGSGDLVEQMKAGAEVDILITASKGTMDDAEEAELIDPATRVDMFNNDLVVIRAEGSDIEVNELADVAAEEITQIAIGDAATVPAGKYANQSLYTVGLYSDESGANGEYAPEIADKVNLADKVGTAAKYVSTGDCQVGFVYSSDVFRYDGIEIALVCPADSHKPIVYPGAVCATCKETEAAQAFLDFCLNDPEAFEIWSEYGFEVAEEEVAAPVYADGTYTATGKGIGGDVPVAVTVEGGKIVAVEVGSNAETVGIGSKAIEQLPALIVEANGTAGVDGVSGATITSKAIFNAVNEALEAASASEAEPAA